MNYDCVVVGSGSAGSVLASRLSENPALKVLLIESGPTDQGLLTNTLVRMPKGLALLLPDARFTHRYHTRPINSHGENVPDTMIRGRMIGGSSALNGMIYHRGQPQDYDGWAQLGNSGWSWEDVLPYFVKLEDHQLPATQWRGHGGPIALTIPDTRTRLNEALIEAAQSLGLPRKEEPNLADQRGVSYVVTNIDRHGRRVSAARGFLPPAVRRRENLQIVTDTRVERILFEDRRAVGVMCTRQGTRQEYRVKREVVLCAGAIQSPVLLQLSGVGPAPLLSSLGIPVVHSNAHVGAHLLDHWNYNTSYDLRDPTDSLNREYRGWRLLRNVIRYGIGAKGPLATAPRQLVAFAQTLPGEARADIQVLFGAYSTEGIVNGRIVPAQTPTMSIASIPLRSTSEGSVSIESADPNVAPVVSPNYLSSSYDRQLTVNAARFIRKLFSQPQLQKLVLRERPPGDAAQSDDEIIAHTRATGSSTMHTCGTCKMGPGDDPTAVVDSHLRVKGVGGVRVADCSFFPTIVSANTNGPAMALAWRAADLILSDLAA